MDSNVEEMQKRLGGLQISQKLQGQAKSFSVAEFLDLRAKGNQLFVHGDWKGAISCYSKCIDFALSSKQEIYKEAMDVLVFCYSNRAEALLKVEEYAKAVEDCDKALQLHSTHLKSLFRKGRALHELKEYNLACLCFRLALEQSPAAEEIKSHYEKSKKFNEENQQGKFNLSAYFLNGCRGKDIPEVSNYIGPVIIKKSSVHGRGLFASKEFEIGDFVLVENAIAVSGIYRRLTAIAGKENPSRMIDRLKQDTVEKAISCAMGSPRILRQLQDLTNSSWLNETDVPEMEAFKINNGSWNKFGENPENLHLNPFELRKAMEFNALIIYITQEEDNPGEPDLSSKGWVFNMKRITERCGFWGLASFINHSCFPNAKYMVVGKAMFIIAVRRIEAGEEITVPYCRTLAPLVRREKYCTQMGFRCECKRCVFERSLGPSFLKLTNEILASHRWLMGDLANGLTNVSSRDMESLVELLLQLKKFGADGEKKHLINASFVHVYYFVLSSAMVYVSVQVLSRLLPTSMEVAEAIQHAVPGSAASLDLFRLLPKVQMDLHLEKATEDGITIIGKQKARVLKTLVASKIDAVSQSVMRTWNAPDVKSR
ncbi:methyltransferase FGSG_00040 [Cryptomeria japonica]|uniref:methyltransferase FGSG_00040 n=1 Tax=Cryptomeria japonica TaxID=3369 RepID=UPI0027DA3537|nr:methyltransferase FGSG_00040 [Cryptomeria japonica]